MYKIQIIQTTKGNIEINLNRKWNYSSYRESAVSKM